MNNVSILYLVGFQLVLMTDEKYPKEIQELFAPKLPLIYIPPNDYHDRKTATVTPISNWKEHYLPYLQQLKELESKQVTLTKYQLQIAKSKQKQLSIKQNYQRQLDDWNNLELLQKKEQEFMKDPFKTIFVSRLDYSINELDLSKKFIKFGTIESIRIIRDKSGKSRGYGFIVFEKLSDANNCIHELSRTGLKMGDRTILVDIERGRIIRNWKPRRLGGGLGGRHYTKPDNKFNVHASAAASGRRYNIANNPHIPYQSKPVIKEKPQDKTVKDKYAKYQSMSY